MQEVCREVAGSGGFAGEFVVGFLCGVGNRFLLLAQFGLVSFVSFVISVSVFLCGLLFYSNLVYRGFSSY